MYGYTKYYSFSVPVNHDTAYTALEIKLGDASTTSFPLQSSIFVVPSMTAVQGSKVDFTVAVRMPAESSSSPTNTTTTTIQVSAPVRQQGTLAPKTATHGTDPKLGTAMHAAPGYQLWEGSVDLGAAVVTGAVAVSAAGTAPGPEGGVVRDVLYLSAGVAGW